MESQTIDYSIQKQGSGRARFMFTLSDGREIFRGPLGVSSESDADSRRVQMESDVLESIQNQDASDAVTNNIKTAYKLASNEQVQYAWLKSGFDEDEHYKAYEKLKDIGPALLSLGLTDIQLAGLFGVPVEDATATREYWEFLDDNKEAIEAYTLIAGIEL